MERLFDCLRRRSGSQPAAAVIPESPVCIFLTYCAVLSVPPAFLFPAEAPHGATGFLQEGDVMVFASRGGKTAELLPILEICRKKGVHVITITENAESPLARGAEVVLRQYVTRETDKYNAQGTTSTTSLCVLFHALQAALIEETDYRSEQFALIHPGGAVGERLNRGKASNLTGEKQCPDKS